MEGRRPVLNSRTRWIRSGLVPKRTRRLGGEYREVSSRGTESQTAGASLSSHALLALMRKFRTAIIGVGKGGEGKAGVHSIGYAHANAYQNNTHTELVGACDLNAENLQAFATAYSASAAYTDLGEMLDSVRPDIVSICTYANSHRALLEQCLAAGVKAIWCEKPLCLAMDDGRAMLQAAEQAGAKVIVNHYRRYLHLFREAKRMLEGGAVGASSIIISSLEGWDLMEWGTHWLDMMRFLSNDQPVSWVMGQARCTGEKKAYAHVVEEHAICYLAFADGVRGLLDGGLAIPGASAFQIIGTEGALDLRSDGKLTLLNADGIRDVSTKSNLHGPWPEHPEEDAWQFLLNDFLRWLDGESEPQVCLRNALASTELYLAAYESAKIGDRIDLPLAFQAKFPLDEIACRQRSA